MPYVYLVLERSTERLPIVMEAISIKFCPSTETVVPEIGIM